MLLSIAAFNYFGISVTKNVSAAARSTIDTTRTVIIWGFSMAIGWEDFILLQLFGFILLTLGMFIFNEIIVFKFWGLHKGTMDYLKAKELIQGGEFIEGYEDLLDPA